MGQLESYTLQDIYLISIMSGFLAAYFAEEIEATIESIMPYIYSINLKSRKKCKLSSTRIFAGDIIGAMHSTYSFLNLSQIKFIAIENPINEREIWQDPFLNRLGESMDVKLEENNKG
jgi:hypothetical protein